MRGTMQSPMQTCKDETKQTIIFRKNTKTQEERRKDDTMYAETCRKV